MPDDAILLYDLDFSYVLSKKSWGGKITFSFTIWQVYWLEARKCLNWKIVTLNILSLYWNQSWNNHDFQLKKPLKKARFWKVLECHFECGVELSIVWDISELSIQYTAEIIEEKEPLFPQNSLDCTFFQGEPHYDKQLSPLFLRIRIL